MTGAILRSAGNDGGVADITTVDDVVDCRSTPPRKASTSSSRAHSHVPMFQTIGSVLYLAGKETLRLRTR